MTDTALALLTSYGPVILAVLIFGSCFALPLPASILLLTAGGFAAVGDFDITTVALLAFFGLVLGDHAVYLLGRYGGRRLARYSGRRSVSLRRAQQHLATRGGQFVFLSRWLFSPLGPYVNFAAGASGMAWPVYALWGLAGEIIWISLYLGIGYVSADNIAAASNFTFDILMIAGAGVAAILFGKWAFARRRHKNARARKEAPSDSQLLGEEGA